MQLTGYLLTADVADIAPLEKVVTVKANEKELPVLWSHDSNRRKHFFTVDSIARMQEDAGKVVVEWDGSPA